MRLVLIVLCIAVPSFVVGALATGGEWFGNHIKQGITTTTTDPNHDLEVACLQGGGEWVRGNGLYALHCEHPAPKGP